ncbi:MAG: hypothetical protein ACFFBY_06640 [Promethearchaeota archaeon]
MLGNSFNLGFLDYTEKFKHAMESWDIVGDNDGLRTRAEGLIKINFRINNSVTAVKIYCVESFEFDIFIMALIVGNFDKDNFEKRVEKTDNILSIFETKAETFLMWNFDENLSVTLRRANGNPLKIKDLYHRKKRESDSFYKAYNEIFSSEKVDSSSENGDLNRYNLKPIDYLSELTTAIKTWHIPERKPDAVRAETDISRKLKGKSKVTALAIEKDSIHTSLFLKIGEFDSKDANLWDKDYIVIIESYLFMATSIFWYKNKDTGFILRMTEGQPLNILKFYSDKYIIG